MQIVLPEKLANKPVYFKTYLHPRTARLAKFLVCDDCFYELTKIGSAMRSALIQNNLKKDGSIYAATPIHPRFMIIKSLFENQSKALPLDILLELGAADEVDNFPAELASIHASAICTVNSGLYQLDLNLLKGFLDNCVELIEPAIPTPLREQVFKCIQPVDPRESPAPELVEQAKKYAAVTFVCTSWLYPSVAQWYLEKHDFSQLESTVANLHRLHVEAQAHQFSQLAYQPAQAGQKTQSTPAPKPLKKKRQAPAAPNNKSLLDMFQARPAKKSRSGP